jgi:hypothetical protein
LTQVRTRSSVGSTPRASMSRGPTGPADDQCDLALERQQFGSFGTLDRCAGAGERAGGFDEVGRFRRSATSLGRPGFVGHVDGDDLPRIHRHVGDLSPGILRSALWLLVRSGHAASSSMNASPQIVYHFGFGNK